MKTHWNRQFYSVTPIEPARNIFILPAFVLGAPEWSGASTLLSLYSFGNTDYKFSLKLPITEFGENFVPSIRYVEDGIVYRFKLWEAGTLYFPVYNGEKIGLNAVLEIWSLNTEDAPVLDENQNLYSSVFTFPSIQSYNTAVFPQEILLTLVPTPDPIPPDTFCNPFCENLNVLCSS